uniref:Conotoxin n=1 Tax=Conus andremenezi TaxID=1077466 RepID=A0A291C1P7_9COND|nr:conotoxin [Conus andremenezi]
MKLSVTFLLILVTLSSLTGEKSSKRTLRDATLRGLLGQTRSCQDSREPCIVPNHCSSHVCCITNTGRQCAMHNACDCKKA